MTKVDPEHERMRLREFYSAIADGELLKIAADRASLTERAQLILDQEITRRGLTSQVVIPGIDQLEKRDLVTIRKFRDLPEALLAKGSLDSAGIECFLVDDNMIRLDWFISNLLGGIKLQVQPGDVEAAGEVLNQPVPDAFEVDGIGEYEQPRCPKCHSLDIGFQELDKFMSYGSAYIGVPIPIERDGWRCHSCHHQWEDGSESESREEC
jgi:hypothetical protein